jgi:hypothetical protein
MKQVVCTIAFLTVLVSACAVTAPILGPTAAATATLSTSAPVPLADTPTPELTSTPEPTSTPAYPPEGYGPTNFPDGIDPLTGLVVANPALLARRPLAIKVSNLPRDIRPQFGLSLADMVFEYYTEEGSTRFIALFYGQDASRVGPIRSARFFDVSVVRGYKAVFAFGYAYIAELQRLYSSEFADRLVVEGPGTPLTRFDPNGLDSLVVNTADLSAYISQQGVENGRQNLDGMSFNLMPPAAGQPVTQVFVRYSAAIYNRWDFDAATGRYLRFSDTADDLTNGQAEKYAQLSDALTQQPVAFDNLVILYVPHELYAPGIYDILLSGAGQAVAFRDGQAYPLNWQRNETGVVTLSNPDGTPFAFKPGATWFEVIGSGSTLAKKDQSWRFTHLMP